MSLAVLALSGCGEQQRTASGPAPTAAQVGTTSGTAAPPIAPGPRRGQISAGSVVFVSDGDTVGIRIGGTLTRVRLIGIDAPETKDPDTPTECYGPESAAAARALLPRGAPVTIVTDPTQDRIDRYGRLLAYVFPRGQPRTVNEQLLRAGAARVYVYRRNRPPKRLAELRVAEDDARTAHRGLWRLCTSTSRT